MMESSSSAHVFVYLNVLCVRMCDTKFQCRLFLLYYNKKSAIIPRHVFVSSMLCKVTSGKEAS